VFATERSKYENLTVQNYVEELWVCKLSQNVCWKDKIITGNKTIREKKYKDIAQWWT